MTPPNKASGAIITPLLGPHETGPEGPRGSAFLWPFDGNTFRAAWTGRVIDSTANHGARDHWPRRMEIDYLRLNNFAFGGINTPLIFRRA